MRLNRHLSLCGLGSRRGCEQIILDGRVTINGKRVVDLATQVTDTDKVAVDGKPAEAKKGIVIALHKPKGYLCTREDTHDRPTIYDLLPARFHTLHHVGRLDQDSEGLLLLTNRGELSQRLMHPGEGVDKEYEVKIETRFAAADLAKLVRGLNTKEGFARAERAWLENDWMVHVVLKQGLKRQIREMFFMLGYEVERLVRTRIGGMWLKGLSKGSWRELSNDEVENYFERREKTVRGVGRPGDKIKTLREIDADEEHFASKAKQKAIRDESKPVRKRGFDHEDKMPKPAPSSSDAPRPRSSAKKRPFATGPSSKAPGGSRARYTERYGASGKAGKSSDRKPRGRDRR